MEKINKENKKEKQGKKGKKNKECKPPQYMHFSLPATLDSAFL